jgi:hypothetical protein
MGGEGKAAKLQASAESLARNGVERICSYMA